jgi:DNA-binding FadR family transcriptional regulator
MKALIAEITTGEVREGESLPSEVNLVERFGVSRTTIRECLRGLEERGLIHVRHGRGAIVAPAREWNVFDPDVLEGLLSGERAPRIRAELMECRQALEVEAAGLAAGKASVEQVRTLNDAVEAMRASTELFRAEGGRPEDFAEADLAFHSAVVDASGNQSLGRIVELIHRTLIADSGGLPTVGAMATAVADHARIFTAIERADAELARTAMRDHLVRYRDTAARRGDGGGSSGSSGNPGFGVA